MVFNPDKPNEVPAALQKSRNTALTEWFELNKHEADVQLPDTSPARDKTGEERSSTDLLYPELSELYVLKMPNIHWSRAVRPTKNTMNIPVGRMYSVLPRAAERYYLRVLFLHVSGATSYEDIRTVKGELRETFHAACLSRL